MKEFKVGDRVAVYQCVFGCQPVREVHEVESIEGDKVQVRVRSSPYFFHVKQCRRLIPKKRKEIWVHCSQDDCKVWSSEPQGAGWIRFIEAKKK